MAFQSDAISQACLQANYMTSPLNILSGAVLQNYLFKGRWCVTINVQISRPPKIR